MRGLIAAIALVVLLARALNSTDVKEKLFNIGTEAVGSSAEALATLVKSDMVKTGRLLKAGGIRD